MEWRDKTWSNETCFTTARFITPCFITPHQILSYATFTMASTTTVCDYMSCCFPALQNDAIYSPTTFFSYLWFFFLLSFCPPWPTQNVETHLTLDKKGMVLAHVLPLGRPTTKLTRRGIRSVDKLLNGYALLDLQRFLKTRKLWSSKANWSLRFSLQSVILADLLGQRTLLKRVQKVIVCDLWLADFNPFSLFLRFKVRCLWS